MADKKQEEKPIKKQQASKTKNPEITDKVKIDLEPSIPPEMYNEDIDYLLGEEDYFEEAKPILEEYFNEIHDLEEAPLTVSARIRKKQTMRRYRSRINIARRRQLRRRATASRINNRARKSAVSTVKRRFASGKSLKNLSYAERGRVEKMAARRKSLIGRTARRMVRVKRQQERMRLSRKSK